MYQRKGYARNNFWSNSVKSFVLLKVNIFSFNRIPTHILTVSIPTPTHIFSDTSYLPELMIHTPLWYVHFPNMKWILILPHYCHYFARQPRRNLMEPLILLMMQ